MNTLDDAWKWYRDTKLSLERVHRLGDKHWHQLPWQDASLSILQDDRFRELEGADISRPAHHALQHLADLAIVVMFSVFEAVVRDQILRQIRSEISLLRHPTLLRAALDAADRVELGSFYQVLVPFREKEPELTEEVDQVRSYRNWVAHGKRLACKNQVTPEVAFDRLCRFLERFVTSPPARLTEC